MPYLAGIDVGTTSLKAALFDDGLNALARSNVEYPTHYGPGGKAEQNPGDWRRALALAVNNILEESSVSPQEIAAVGVAGMSSLALPVDNQGEALLPGMIWLDRRARDQDAFIKNNHHDLQVAVSGNRSDASNFAPKVMWIRDNEPEIYKKTAWFLHCPAYLVLGLTGVPSMDVSQAGMSQLCDIRTGEYSGDLIAACGLDPDKLPAILDCNVVAGTVTASAARETGLAQGTPVVAGCMDNVAAVLGQKLWKTGDAYISAGTATNVGVLLDQPEGDGLGLLYHYAAPGKWLLNGGVDFGAAGLYWFRNLLGASYEEINALEETCGDMPHPLLFLPYLAPQRAPFWDSSSSGALVGLTPETRGNHIARAIMEGVAFGAKHALDTLSRTRPRELTLAGGPTNNTRWVRIFCNAMNTPLTSRTDADVTTLGAAMLAGVGISMFPSFEDALALAPSGETFSPDPAGAARYAEIYDVFVEMHAAMRHGLERLAKLKDTNGGAA